MALRSNDRIAAPRRDEEQLFSAVASQGQRSGLDPVRGLSVNRIDHLPPELARRLRNTDSLISLTNGAIVYA